MVLGFFDELYDPCATFWTTLDVIGEFLVALWAVNHVGHPYERQ
jgi:hypothetical protein